MVELRGTMRDEAGGESRARAALLQPQPDAAWWWRWTIRPTRPLQPLDEGARRIVQARRRGTVHPAELVKLLAPARGDRDHGGRPAGALRRA